jgi:hypothetical protein
MASDVITDTNNDTRVLWSDPDGYLHNVETDAFSLGTDEFFTDAFSLSNMFFVESDVTASDAYIYKYVLNNHHVDVNVCPTGQDTVVGPTWPGKTPLITISQEGGIALPGWAKYKISLKKIRQLYRKNSNNTYIGLDKYEYEVMIYTNFNTGDNSTYVVSYNKADTRSDDSGAHYYVTNQENGYTENLNGISVMLRDSVNNLLIGTPYYATSGIYTVRPSEGGYRIMVGPENAAAPDYRNRQGFVWRLLMKA